MRGVILTISRRCKAKAHGGSDIIRNIDIRYLERERERETEREREREREREKERW